MIHIWSSIQILELEEEKKISNKLSNPLSLATFLCANEKTKANQA